MILNGVASADPFLDGFAHKGNQLKDIFVWSVVSSLICCEKLALLKLVNQIQGPPGQSAISFFNI